MRQVSQSDTPASFGAEPNPPIYVYDCSGPYSDPEVKIDIRSGLPALRAAWIAERGDTEELPGPTSQYGIERLNDPKLAELRFNLHRKPRQAIEGKNVTQMHYARQGIITPEMEYIAIRENLQRKEYLESLKADRPDGPEAGRPDGPPASGPVLRRFDPGRDHAGIRAQRSRPRPRDHPRTTSTTRKASR